MPEREGGGVPEEFDEGGNRREREFAEGELESARTDRGHREAHTDDQGRLDFEREYFYTDEEAFKKGDYRGYEKKYEFVDDLNAKTERGKDLHQKNSWEIDYRLNEQGEVADRTGEILSGPDKGHRWKETFLPTRDAIVVIDGLEVAVTLKQKVGEILAQGDNSQKEPTGQTWNEWKAFRKDTGAYVTHWGEKEIPREEGQPEYSEWGNPPEAIK